MTERRVFIYCDGCEKIIEEHKSEPAFTNEFFKKHKVIPLKILSNSYQYYDPIFCTIDCFKNFVEKKSNEWLDSLK